MYLHIFLITKYPSNNAFLLFYSLFINRESIMTIMDKKLIKAQ